MKKDVIIFKSNGGKIVLGKTPENTCRGCGFIYGGIMRCHNMNGECSVWSKINISKLMKGGEQRMKKSKGLTKNQKLKTLKTSKLKKLVKSTKK